MDEQIKRYIDSGDLRSVKYVFADSLDVDPTFARYEEAYNYCKSVGMPEAHVELTPFSHNPSDWNEDYWTSLKTDLVKNFSDRRMMHMRDVAQVYLAEKVQRIKRERAAGLVGTAMIMPVSAPKTASTPKSPVINMPTGQKTSKAQEQARQLEEARIKQAAAYQAQQQEIEREKMRRRSEASQEEHDDGVSQGENQPKKAIGIVVAAAVIAAIIILILILQ